MENCVKVCVTGGAGYIASFLINHLLQKGYTVHATLRNLRDDSKVGLLKGFAHAEERLKLFEADIYNPDEFSSAIHGCEFVFHLATPFQHYADNPKYKNTIEAAADGAKTIVESCIRSKTVKRLIYTATVLAASPLKDDGSGYKDVMDENCWTPLNLSFPLYYDYISSKTLSEKEVLSYNGKGIEVVSLALPLVGGDTVRPYISESMTAMISQAMKDEFWYKTLRNLEDVDSKVPIAHVEDVVEALIFSMENSNINGRFLVASDFLKSAEIAYLIHKSHPDITVRPEFIEDTKRETKWGSRKLQDLGFEYKFGAEKIIYDSIACAKRLGNNI